MEAKELYTATEFSFVVFETTHETFKGENALEEEKIPYVTVPVPREISSGCGLGIRVTSNSIQEVKNSFEKMKVNYGKLYLVTMEDGHKKYMPL